MSGSKSLYIAEDGKVYKIPQSKNRVSISNSNLANQSVLEVFLYYETKERKPFRLISIGFDRLQLDNIGQYQFTDEEMKMKMRNFNEFAFYTAEDFSKKPEPWPIPDAAVIPNKIEKDVLVNFLKEEYPLLSNNCLQIIEREVQRRKSNHANLINLIKTAIKIKNKKVIS